MPCRKKKFYPTEAQAKVYARLRRMGVSKTKANDFIKLKAKLRKKKR